MSEQTFVQPPSPGLLITPLTRPNDPPAAHPLAVYTAILIAAQRLSVHYDAANPAWDQVIAGYVRAIH